jgi:ATP-dependent RNA helicase RhlE
VKINKDLLKRRQPFMTFKELNISEPILKALEDVKYETPTPIQEKAIPAALGGYDLLGLAQTGTGKTAAFAIPIIQHLNHPQPKGQRREIKALILCPTRELAIQISDSFSDYGKYTNISHTVIFGGVNQNPQVEQLRRGVDILVATPGRLLDLIGQKHISLNHITHFVLDEADRMLDMGFIHDIKRLLPMLPKRKQTLFFSATMPAAIAELSKSILFKPLKVEVTPVASVVDLIDQHLYFVEKPDKSDLLFTLLKQDKERSVLVFSRTKHGADKIAKALSRKGIDCEAIHGNKTQTARQRALTNFKSRKTRVIIATDIAARGIDIDNLEVVINYDLPDVAETYVHRIGRTGRAGNRGTALTFCSEDEFSMVKSIQRLTGNKLNQIMV